MSTVRTATSSSVYHEVNKKEVPRIEEHNIKYKIIGTYASGNGRYTMQGFLPDSTNCRASDFGHSISLMANLWP